MVDVGLPSQLAAHYLFPVLAIPFAVALATVHVVAVHVVFREHRPREVVLSAAAGASVSYVFVHLLPEIGRIRREMATYEDLVPVAEMHAYLVALLGFVAYYGMERFVQCSVDVDGSGTERPSPGVFWLHLSSFALYNVLVGYLLVHREEPGLLSLGLFAVAIGLHFLVNDYGLRRHYPQRYHAYGRWLLAAAVLVGTAIGSLTAIHRVLTGTLFAFLAGGVVLNAIKEELPEQRESRFWAFAVGAFAYAAFLVPI